jgi:hypothetical protein
MTLVLAVATAIVFVPILLALGARAEGHDVLRELLRALRAVPELVRDGTGRACREAWSWFQDALRLGGIRENWVQQSFGALLFAGAALVGIAALVLNFITALSSAMNSKVPLIETLTSIGVGPVLLTGLEMGLACLLFGAVLLDLLGITNISYFFSEENISGKWKRYAWVLFFAGGALACGVFAYQTGLLRGRGVEGAGGGPSLVETTLGPETSSQGRPQAGGQASGTGKAASTSPGEGYGMSMGSLVALTAVLGFLAGAVALVFMIPATPLLLATPLFLAVAVPAGLLWLLAYLAVLIVDRVYTFMLSMFNYALRLRGEEPVEATGESARPGEPEGQAEESGETRTNGRATSAPGSGQSSSRGSDPAPQGDGTAEDRQPENGRSGDPAEDAAETGPLYEEDDENWNPIA